MPLTFKNNAKLHHASSFMTNFFTKSISASGLALLFLALFAPSVSGSHFSGDIHLDGPVNHPRPLGMFITYTPLSGIGLAGESASPDLATYTLGNGYFIEGSFSNTTPPGPIVAGNFSVSNDGRFHLSFDLDNDVTFFVLTLEGLLPENGSIINGFHFIDGDADFYNSLYFSFDNAANGVVKIWGDTISGAYIDGYFTATVIPEPATIALGLGALASVIAALKRRRASRA